MPYNAPALLSYAGRDERQQRILTAGAVVLLSLVPAGLGCVLVRGRSRLGLVLAINGGALAVGVILLFTWPIVLPNVDSDWAELLWLAGCAVVSAAGAYLAVRDWREMNANVLSPVAPLWLWMLLFWCYAALAATGLVSAAGMMVLLIAFSGFHPMTIVVGVALIAAFVWLIVTVCYTWHWYYRKQRNSPATQSG